MLAGLALLPLGPFWRGFGLQALSWGAVDAIIAGVGRRSMLKRRAELANPADLASMRSEMLKLRRLLWLNTFLDVLYIGGGLRLNVTRGRHKPAWRGHGWGIVTQGIFLFLFDLYHVQLMPTGEPVHTGSPDPENVHSR
jgi:hypothetical protein